MEYRELGTTGIKLSTIGFGAWTVTSGWWGDYSREDAIRMIREAYDAGITFFNTGNTYGENGYGEKVVAEALADVRDKVVFGTTFGYVPDGAREGAGHRERPQDWSPENLRRSLEESLGNLGTDCIDVWQLHNPKMDAMQDDALWAELDAIKSEGLVRAIGPSIGPRIGWRDEGVFALENRDIDFVHHIYNMLEQDPGREFNERAAERGIGVLVRVPHSSGLLEDRYDESTTFDANDHRSHRPKEWLSEGLRKIDQIRFLMDERTAGDAPATMGQVALKWLLSDPVVTCAQPNFYDSDQIREFALATEVDEFDADELGEVDTLYELNFGVESELVGAGA